MGNSKLRNALLYSINAAGGVSPPVQRNGLCVYDYIWSVVRGERGFKRHTFKTLVEEILQFLPNEETRPNTDEILRWRNGCHTNVSLYALDQFYVKLVSEPALQHKKAVQLVFVVKDGHLNPITNRETITKISKTVNLLQEGGGGRYI